MPYLSARYLVLLMSALVFLLSVGLALFQRGEGWWLAVPSGALTLVGIIDVVQTRQALRRNYPILAHFRYFFESIKMIELKLSQGAKPGQGGILPGAKVSLEIAAARGVPAGLDCISPASPSTFSTPVGMLHFIERLRARSGGKPTGFKLAIGHPW